MQPPHDPHQDTDDADPETRESYESTSTITGLVIGAVLLLLGAGAYWWWSQRRERPESFESFESRVIVSPAFQKSNILF
jgi:hypothetical protein